MTSLSELMDESSDITEEELNSAREAATENLTLAWSLREMAYAYESANISIDQLELRISELDAKVVRSMALCRKEVLAFIKTAIAHIWEEIGFGYKRFATAHEAANYAGRKAILYLSSAAKHVRRMIDEGGSSVHVGSEFRSGIVMGIHETGDFERLQEEPAGLGIKDRIDGEHAIAIQALRLSRAQPVWSRLLSVKQIAHLLGLSTRNPRARTLETKLKAIGSELDRLPGKQYRVRLDTMHETMRRRFEKE